jgi:hypothetical protein
MECKFCGSPYLERLRRNGILGAWLPSLCGFYPWQCLTCFRLQLHHARRTPEGHVSTVDQPG